jgi:hypothetical protein
MVARVIPSTTEAFREQTKGIENQFALLPAERVKEFAHQLALGDLGPRNFHDRKVWFGGRHLRPSLGASDSPRVWRGAQLDSLSVRCLSSYLFFAQILVTSTRAASQTRADCGLRAVLTSSP